MAADKDVIILRTFSKLFGMAGLRAGAAIGRPDLLAKMQPYGAGAHPVTGMVGATASLKVKSLVPERRKIIAEVRNEVFDKMSKKGYKFMPSESNNFMLDVGKPGQSFVQGMFNEKILVGRVWPALPNHVRISVGTREEMAKFLTALDKVMQA